MMLQCMQAIWNIKSIYVFYNVQPVTRDAMQVAVWG